MCDRESKNAGEIDTTREKERERVREIELQSDSWCERGDTGRIERNSLTN